MKTQSSKESAAVQEGKSYAYQSPQESHAGEGSPLDEQKRKVVDAFDNFMDALVCRTGDGPGEGGGAVMGTPSVAGTGHMTGSGTSSGVGVGTGVGTSTGVATVPSGAPAMGKPSNGGVQPSGKGEKASEAAKAAMEREASERSIFAQREAYQLDVAREARRKSERARESTVAGDGIPVVIGLGKNKHMSDSNRAPVSDQKEFAPSYGSAGKTSGSTREVTSQPLSQRPETVPAPGFVTVGKPLDAFFGSFGTAIEKAKERARTEQRLMEVVIGNDDRVRVTNNEVYPWCCICSLLITANTGMSYIGTGWLVAPRLVLTAGHCVFMSDENGWVSQIEVIPGRDADSRPFGSAIARDFRSVTGWTQDNNSNFDYGAILLPPENRYGEQLGWFGYTNRDDDYLRDVTLNLAGYPGDGGPAHVDGSQWFHSRKVRDVFDRQLTYEIDTYGGQSGAPVWEMASDGSRYGVAIHTFGTSVNNGGTRITSDVFDNIVQWAGQVP